MKPVLVAFGVLLLAGIPSRSSQVEVELGMRDYRGAVLMVRFPGDPSEFSKPGTLAELRFDFYQDGTALQTGTPVEYTDGDFMAEIVDLRFLLHRQIDAVLTTQGILGLSKEIRFRFVMTERCPWIDWMLEPDDFRRVEDDFRYDWPDSPNGLGAHASWDIFTRPGATVSCGTKGTVFRKDYQPGVECVYVYNPYTGGILQYGHVYPARRPAEGMSVYAGEPIGAVVDNDDNSHIHFSVIRPLGWDGADVGAEPYWRESIYHGTSIFDSKYYQDPFYFHEPATWGYWNEETVPTEWLVFMKESFRRHNPQALPQ